MIFSYLLNMQSHPSWVCGLKREPLHVLGCCSQVTPFVGVWIETCLLAAVCLVCRSHPSWVCGLKLPLGALPQIWRCHTLRGCVE